MAHSVLGLFLDVLWFLAVLVNGISSPLCSWLLLVGRNAVVFGMLHFTWLLVEFLVTF